jgi:hypothetical protein
MSALQAILDDPRYHDYLAILKGARNGLVYGFKVRFPHALIMAILFGRGEYVPFLPLHTDVNYFIVPLFPPWTPSPPCLCPHFVSTHKKKKLARAAQSHPARIETACHESGQIRRNLQVASAPPVEAKRGQGTTT